MPQNIYDSAEFFERYSHLQRSREGLGGAAEWPTLRDLVGDPTGAKVLDIGCGYGWFCRWVSEAGARKVHGIDVSLRMLEKARSYPHDHTIEYELGDLEKITLPADEYDIAYSSLTLHYVPDLRAVFRNISTCLKPGGLFVFSVEHPAMTAPSTAAWREDDSGKPYWPLNDYAKEGLRITDWLGAGDVHKYHHRVETYVMALLESGFSIEALRESWNDQDLSCDAGIAESGHRPYFMLVKASKA